MKSLKTWKISINQTVENGNINGVFNMYIDTFLQAKQLSYTTLQDRLDLLELNVNHASTFEADNALEDFTCLNEFVRFLNKNNLDSRYFRVGIEVIYFAKQDLIYDNVQYRFVDIYKMYMNSVKRNYPNFVII